MKTPLICLCLLIIASPTMAQDDASHEDLAKKLANPIASMISAPFQFNYDTGLGETDADRWILNIQPVFPFELNEDWNLISRTIVPVIDLESPTVGGKDVSGVGDIVQSFFFSPKAPTKNGWIWGVGPVISIPVGKDAFTADQWGLGPTFVALKQQGSWTYGALLNHVWGIDAPSDRASTDSTFLQPFIAYVTPTAWTFNVLTETTYDWNTKQWTVPVIANVSKLTHIGKQPVSFQVGYRHYFDAPDRWPRARRYRKSSDVLRSSKYSENTMRDWLINDDSDLKPAGLKCEAGGLKKPLFSEHLSKVVRYH